MSRIAFTGNASGTGTVTMAAPNTNSDRTVTLPDQTGTLYISGGDIGTPSGGDGTNLTNLNASNLASGTVGTARLATGTANSTTYLRGDQTWAAVAGYSGPQAQAFTSNGTFTIPAGSTRLKVTVVGGGSGGSGNNSQGRGGAGGGAAISFLTGLTPGNTLSVTIGGGGGGSTGVGGTGGTSSVASGSQSISTISATGGVANGAGGIGSGGTLNIGGQGSGSGGGSGGGGGSSIFGGGGAAGGGAGRAYGGAGGGNSDSCSTVSGGSGAAGVVLFEY